MQQPRKIALGQRLDVVGQVAGQALNLIVTALMVDEIDYPKEYDRARHQITW